jgi:xanthine dehydrogenase accessory factor
VRERRAVSEGSDTLAREALRWCRDGVRAVVVEVASTRGSAPREAGARMLVSAHEVLGSIGGGHLEWQAIARARQCLGGAAAAGQTQQVALGPTLGQCCGGVVTLRYQDLTANDVRAWTPEAPRFTLQLHGAGHVGRALVRLLADLPCRVQWVDEREAGFPHEATSEPRPPHIARVATDSAAGEVAAAAPGAFYLVMTHSHALDMAIVRAILQRGDFGFLGLIGSATKRAAFCSRLHGLGVDPAQLERLTCPIGLAGIVGKKPELIALSVAAQLMQVTATHPPHG